MESTEDVVSRVYDNHVLDESTSPEAYPEAATSATRGLHPFGSRRAIVSAIMNLLKSNGRDNAWGPFGFLWCSVHRIGAAFRPEPAHYQGIIQRNLCQKTPQEAEPCLGLLWQTIRSPRQPALGE